MYIHTYRYIYAYIIYIYTYADVPVVEITTATGGCGYVYVSWTVIGNNDVCDIASFTVQLVSVPMSITEQISTDMNSYNFTGLPDDTLFDITIIGSSPLVNTDPVSTSVRTMIFKSTYACAYTITAEPVYYGHLRTNRKCPDCQGVLIFQVSITIWDHN